MSTASNYVWNFADTTIFSYHVAITSWNTKINTNLPGPDRINKDHYIVKLDRRKNHDDAHIFWCGKPGTTTSGIHNTPYTLDLLYLTCFILTLFYSCSYTYHTHCMLVSDLVKRSAKLSGSVGWNVVKGSSHGALLRMYFIIAHF